MKIEIENFNTGWYGLQLGIKENEIDSLIDCLEMLRTQSHFHLRSDFEGHGGIGDVEIYLQSDEIDNNISLDSSAPIPPGGVKNDECKYN